MFPSTPKSSLNSLAYNNLHQAKHSKISSTICPFEYVKQQEEYESVYRRNQYNGFDLYPFQTNSNIDTNNNNKNINNNFGYIKQQQPQQQYNYQQYYQHPTHYQHNRHQQQIYNYYNNNNYNQYHSNNPNRFNNPQHLTHQQYYPVQQQQQQQQHQQQQQQQQQQQHYQTHNTDEFHQLDSEQLQVLDFGKDCCDVAIVDEKQNDDSGIGIEDIFDIVNINQKMDDEENQQEYDVNFEKFYAGINSGEKVYNDCRKVFEFLKKNLLRYGIIGGEIDDNTVAPAEAVGGQNNIKFNNRIDEKSINVKFLNSGYFSSVFRFSFTVTSNGSGNDNKDLMEKRKRYRKAVKVFHPNKENVHVYPKCIDRETRYQKCFSNSILSNYIQDFISLYDGFYSYKNIHVAIMDYAESDMFDYVSNRKISSIDNEEFLYVAKKLASAVSFLFSKRIIHRDIKLENILLFKKQLEAGDGNKLFMYNLKLSDFNLSILDKSNVYHEIAGTELYMSPEMVNGTGYTAKTDIWSLGCLFLFLSGGYFSERLKILDNVSSGFEYIFFKNNTSYFRSHMILNMLQIDIIKRFDINGLLAYIDRYINSVPLAIIKNQKE